MRLTVIKYYDINVPMNMLINAINCPAVLESSAFTRERWSPTCCKQAPRPTSLKLPSSREPLVFLNYLLSQWPS